ncbi:MAG TPA: ferrochelatase, partial [Coriobacteriia bacterium]
MARTGVLLTAFGGPDCLDAVAPFMCSIMGAELSEQMLAEARRKYLTIGGFSPLPAMAERIAAQLERVLNGIAMAEVTDDGGTLGLWGGAMASLRTSETLRIPVAIGMLHSEPSIEGAVARLVDAGARQIVIASLSPFEAAATTGAYLGAVRSALEGHPGVRLMESASYHRSDEFVGLYADNLNEALHE